MLNLGFLWHRIILNIGLDIVTRTVVFCVNFFQLVDQPMTKAKLGICFLSQVGIKMTVEFQEDMILSSMDV